MKAKATRLRQKIEFRASIAFLGWLKPLEGYVNGMFLYLTYASFLSNFHISGPGNLFLLFSNPQLQQPELSGLHIAGPNSLLDSATLDVHGKSCRLVRTYLIQTGYLAPSPHVLRC
ncbi:hypothetical protein Y032_0269g819 [Ancylostoma ceylanicum]|uniref:Uncharacterized protein n=1 Tax=Ancylostoma ceylanicum TaxID=53326 RepID=A0A016S9N8_9BILA|nr:hypothetical protein Y032_0269g819 [Ancylostoma ceylanicum]